MRQLHGIDASSAEPAKDQRQDGEHEEDEEEDPGTFPGDHLNVAEPRKGGEHGDHEEHDRKS